MRHPSQPGNHGLQHGAALLQPPASDLIRVGSRRWFLQTGLAGVAGLSLPVLLRHRAHATAKGADRKSVITVWLSGGPSQLDTWDPKPDAPAEIRGPFKPIATNVPGMRISEIFPRMARHADKYSLIRSVYHTATAVHDTGHQMMQTGRLFTGGIEHPHVGCVLGYVKGQRGEVPAHVLLPKPIGRTGGNLPHGHTAGYLGRQHDPFILNADPAVPNFQVPDLLPPSYISNVRADRRQRMREAVDAAVASFESSQQARQLDR